MAIEANDQPFTFHAVGETSDQTWTGEFRAKRWLSHRDQLTKDQVRRELLGGQTGMPTERALSTSMMLAELRVRLTAYPEWWITTDRGLDLADDNVVYGIYEKAITIENEAIEAKKKKAEKIQEQLVAAAKKKADEEAEADASQMAAAGIK